MPQRLGYHSEKSVAPLAVNPSDEDLSALRQILSQLKWKLNSVSTMEEARSSIIRCGPPAIVICERDLPDGNWKLLFGETESLPRPPKFIVSSRLADEYLWSEVLNIGAYDV